MKKRVFLIFLSLILLSTFFVSADGNSTDSKGYACLTNLVSTKNCSSLSTEEKIFSLLSIGQCKNELIADESSNSCWPKSGCAIKTTAQAVIALSAVGVNTNSSQTWLMSQMSNFSDMNWFLQIDSNNATSCTASYSGSSYTFLINGDKTIVSDAGNCLTNYNNYWLQVSPSCYGKEFDISCNNSFLTSLFYQNPTTNTIFVSDQTPSATAGGTTSETVLSSCFKKGSLCDYEGTLWAAIVLNSKKKDVSSLIPYLTADADNNPAYLPESFLYILTGNFQTDLMAKQIENKWWSVSGDKFYDTAVALFPFQSQDLTQKTSSESWLASVQGADGCWQDNIRNTAFLLYSLWPRSIATTESNSTLPDCESSGNFCISSNSCSEVSGNILNSYSGCFGVNVCCNRQQVEQTCSQQNGNLCTSGQICTGGTEISSSDSTSSAVCCSRGTCEVSSQTTVSDCENNSGVCADSCNSNQQSSFYSCESSSQICCVPKKSNSTWVVIGIISGLIVLAILGIIFRKKLRDFLFRLKSGKGKGKPPAAPSSRFPPSSSTVYPGAVQRRIIPQQQPQRAPMKKPEGNNEVDDVLKKLKEIGK